MNRLTDFSTPDRRLVTDRGVYLSLTAYLFALLPISVAHPGWETLLCLLMTAWRVRLVHKPEVGPPRLLVPAVAVFGIALMFVTYGNIDTSLRAVLSLAILVACRNLQSHYASQWSTSLILLPFFPMGFFLDENPDWYVFYCIAFYLLWALATLEMWGNYPRSRLLLKRGCQTLLMSLPILVLSFYFMPRPSNIWKQSRAPVTGMSNTLKPGSVGKLAKSDALAFTASVGGPLPSEDLYWRGAVLRSYDGFEWRENNKDLSDWKVRDSGKQLSYTILVPDAANGFRYVMETASMVTSIDNRPGPFKMSGSGTLTSPGDEFVLYKVYSNPANRLISPPSAGDSRLPNGVHPKTNALVAQFKRGASTPVQFLANAQAWFTANEFTYSMEPGEMRGDWMDTFLFDRRKGFCEHYASTMTYMLRQAGFHARVVVGYQGGDYQEKGHFYSVPQAAAHAWSEYWDSQAEQWVRFDPTGWVSPERFAPSGWKELERQLLQHEKDGTLFGKMRFMAVQLSSQWNRWVANYDAEEQRSMFRNLDKDAMLKALYALLSGVALVLIFLLKGHWLFYRAPRAALFRMEKRFRGLGMEAPVGMTPTAKVAVFVSDYPQYRDALNHWLDEYSAQAYGGGRGEHLGWLTTKVLLAMPFESVYSIRKYLRTIADRVAACWRKKGGNV